MIPAQVPGGVELLVIALILFVPVALVAGVVGAILYVRRRRVDSHSRSRRLEDLERRVDALEERVERETESGDA